MFRWPFLRQAPAGSAEMISDVRFSASVDGALAAYRRATPIRCGSTTCARSERTGSA